MAYEGKHLIIIGGVAAGMKAAAKARRESPAMKITVVTDEEYISYAGCGMPYFIGDIINDSQKLLVREPPYFKNMHNIDVLTRHQAIAIDIKSKQVKVKNLEYGHDLVFNYAKLILATGAQPVVPPLPGISLGNIFTLRTINDAIKIKSCVDSGKVKNAVIVGGGLIGLEMAENLVLRGIKVTVVELLDQILPPLDKDMALLVQHHLTEKGVGVITSDGVKSFEGNGGICIPQFSATILLITSYTISISDCFSSSVVLFLLNRALCIGCQTAYFKPFFVAGHSAC